MIRLALCGALALAGCSDPSRATSDAPAGGDGSAAILDASPDAPPDAPGIPFNCTTDTTLHFDVHPVAAGTIPDGRLIVDIYQLLDNLPVPQYIAYDVPFSGTATSVDLALADITLPAALDDYYVCQRTCGDLSNPACDCPANGEKIALAFVFVLNDLDHSGAIEPVELTQTNRYGVGVMQLGQSDRAYPPPTTLDPLVPEGIQGCMAPYRIIPHDMGHLFDKLGIPTTTTFPLDVCVPGSPSCSMLRVANLN
jgi:hypothetical protein